MHRKIFAICFLSMLMVLGQIVIARLVPMVGSIFYIPTVIVLSILEESGGLRTPKGSSEGWPIPTTLGWQLTAIFWWLFWIVFLTLIYGVKHYRSKNDLVTR